MGEISPKTIRDNPSEPSANAIGIPKNNKKNKDKIIIITVMFL